MIAVEERFEETAFPAMARPRRYHDGFEGTRSAAVKMRLKARPV